MTKQTETIIQEFRKKFGDLTISRNGAFAGGEVESFLTDALEEQSKETIAEYVVRCACGSLLEPTTRGFTDDELNFLRLYCRKEKKFFELKT